MSEYICFQLKNEARLGLKRFDIEKDAVQFYFDEVSNLLQVP